MIDGPLPTMQTLLECGPTDGKPWVPWHLPRPAITARHWDAVTPGNAWNLETAAELAYPALGVIVGGVPLGLLSADALLAAGCPEEIVNEVRPWLGVDGYKGLEAIERRDISLPDLGEAPRRVLFNRAKAVLERTP